MYLKGRTALVTGGSSGIGLATAKLFASHGARVAITGLDEARLEAARAQIGTGALTMRADVRSFADLTALRNALGCSFGRLDVLFANAGVAFGLQTGEREQRQSRRPALTAPARDAPHNLQAGTKERPHGTNKGTAP